LVRSTVGQDELLPQRIGFWGGGERLRIRWAAGAEDFFERQKGITAGIGFKAFGEAGIGIGMTLLLRGALAQAS